MRTLRVGTRGSELALVQTRRMMASLAELVPDLRLEIETIRTKGDKVTDVRLDQVGDQGLFIKELETALLEKRIDFAVHSMKDVPSQISPGLVLAATTERLDPRDALISRGARSLADLPQKATLATGSLRRCSQALALRPDLQVVALRGNVTTRLQKFDSSSWDGMILAGAGLQRLGLDHRISAPLPTDQMLPAVGQGALAIEARGNDLQVLEWLGLLGHLETAVAVDAERAFLRKLEGGCTVPIAALGSVAENRLTLEGYVGTVEGDRYLRRRAEGSFSEPDKIGTALAEQMLADGAKEILDAGFGRDNQGTFKA